MRKKVLLLSVLLLGRVVGPSSGATAPTEQILRLSLARPSLPAEGPAPKNVPSRIYSIAIPPTAKFLGLRNAPPGVSYVRSSVFRKYRLIDIRVEAIIPAAPIGRPSSPALLECSLAYEEDGTEPPAEDRAGIRAEAAARDIIFNYDQTAEWYRMKADRTSGPRHDLVIITLDGLISAVAPLVAWERAKGRAVNVVTSSWIERNSQGRDPAQKIRNFLRSVVFAWGVEDVLLAGHWKDLPMRRVEPAGLFSTKPETDFYYAELSRPDEESWDANGDLRYGAAGDSFDYYAEVNVGRIPWSDPAVVRRICEKTVAYEKNDDPRYKNNILLLASFVDARTDGAIYMEYTVDSEKHPWMSRWTKTRLYQSGSPFRMDLPLNHDNVVAAWSKGKFAVVSWHGHGSPKGSSVGRENFITADDCARLNDEFPAIVSAASCSNADTDYLNIGQALMRQGAVGFLGANKTAKYGSGWRTPDDGSDQSFKYFFLSTLTSGAMTQGQAHQYAIRQMYVRGMWDDPVYETLVHGSLWGHPGLGIAPVSVAGPRHPESVRGKSGETHAGRWREGRSKGHE